MQIFDDKISTVLEKALDGSYLRQEAINNNLANVDTPGFKRTEVSFENELRRMLQNQSSEDSLPLKRTNPLHMSGSDQESEFNPEVTVVQDWSQRNSGNNVDIDVEEAKQAKNSLYYDAVATNLNFKFKSLATVITGGK